MNNDNRKSGTNLWFHKSKFWQAYISYTDKNFTHKFYAQSIQGCFYRPGNKELKFRLGWEIFSYEQ